MLSRQIMFGLAMTVSLLALTCIARADDASDKQDEKAAAEKQAADKVAADKAREEFYKMPEGGVKELLTFIKKLREYRPKERADIAAYQAKMQSAMKSAAEKITELATDAEKKLEEVNDAIGMALMYRAVDAQKSGAEIQQKLVGDIKAYLASTDSPSQYALSAPQYLVSSLEYGGKPEVAVDVARQLGAALIKSKDPKSVQAGEKLEGFARRLTLVGNPMRVEGTLMDGSKFDWAKYRGKVVLVDFWATWCGPCIGELPNVRKNYDLYHDRGFDVVGISLDRDHDELEKFLAKEGAPWSVIHDGDWADNVNATYYGVMGIPTVILVDKEGKVVSTNARGPELGKLLEKLLGPPEPSDSDEKTDSSAK